MKHGSLGQWRIQHGEGNYTFEKATTILTLGDVDCLFKLLEKQVVPTLEYNQAPS